MPRTTQLAKPDPVALALAATDPANPYGAALPWPAVDVEAGTGHRPGRKAGALVVMVDGALVLYVERGGKTLLAFDDDADILAAAAAALVGVVTRGAVDKLIMEKVNGHGILDTPIAAALGAGRRLFHTEGTEDPCLKAIPSGGRPPNCMPPSRASNSLASDFRVPRFATLNLAGWTVTEVVPRGKHLLMRVRRPGNDQGTLQPAPTG